MSQYSALEHKRLERHLLFDGFTSIKQFAALFCVEPIESYIERPVFASPAMGTLACLENAILLHCLYTFVFSYSPENHRLEVLR